MKLKLFKFLACFEDIHLVGTMSFSHLTPKQACLKDSRPTSHALVHGDMAGMEGCL